MKILLLKDVPRVGHKGQVLDVSDAYGMNAFVNKGLGKIATPQDIKQLEVKAKKKQEDKDKENDKYLSLYQEIVKTGLIINKKVDDKGRLYAKLSAHDIVDAIFAEFKVSLNEKQISVPEMHELGECEVVLKNNGKDFKVKVGLVK